MSRSPFSLCSPLGIGALCAVVFLPITPAKADISIIPSTNSTELANAVTAGGGAGIQVTSVKLKSNQEGSALATGIFNLSGPLPDTYNMSFPGIVLSTGNVANYNTGPNTSTGQTTGFGVPAGPDDETLLDQITGGNFNHNDVARLDITFNMLPGNDTVFFQVVFGSEEYPEFVNSSFNDGFGLFLNGSNIAFVAGAPININHPAMASVAGTELDGVLAPDGNAVLQFSAFVGAGSIGNTLTIIVADTSDSALDTTVFVSSLGGSIATPPKVPAPPPPPPPGGPCITRPARFWATQVDDPLMPRNPKSVSLLNAVKANGGGVDIGFLSLPTIFRNGDDVLDAVDTTMEALGIFHRSVSYTGEGNGLQNNRLRSSRLCSERKRLAAEIIAATANQMFFRTNPSNCSYRNGPTNVTFSAGVIDEARAANAAEDLTTIRAYTVLLRKFNLSGARAQFPDGLEQASAFKKREARNAARDPTTQLTCPGFNNSCATAEAVTRFPFKASVKTRNFSNNEGAPPCGGDGPDVVWRISPPVAAPGRSFVVSTRGSNFDTVVSVRRGSCAPSAVVACNDNADGFSGYSRVAFTADGESDYYIVVDGSNGAIGSLKLSITSF